MLWLDLRTEVPEIQREITLVLTLISIWCFILQEELNSQFGALYSTVCPKGGARWDSSPMFQSNAEWSEMKRYTRIVFLTNFPLLCCVLYDHNCTTPAGQIHSFLWLAIMWRPMIYTTYLRTLPLEEPVSHWETLDSFSSKAQRASWVNLHGP